MNTQINSQFPGNIVGLIFDCDGVMIDSLDANRFFYNTILAYLGHVPMTEEQEKYAFMASAREALLTMLPQSQHGQIEQACRTALNYSQEVLPRIKLMPGLADFLKKAKAQGVRMAIDTNRTEEGIYRVLDFFDLTDYFNPVISTSSASPKPSPEGALKILQNWNLPAQETLFIGDSENDMLTARNAGIAFAAFKNPALEAAIHLTSFAQLEKTLWQNGKDARL